MTLYEYLYNGFGKEEDLNCAEKMLYGANTVYNLGIDKSDLKLAAGFGGGMGLGLTCGILTGAIMAFSKAFIIERGHESTFLKELESEFITRFKELTSHTDCTPLKEDIFEAAKIFDDIMQRYYKKD